jgi:acetoacetyl-CoA reductase/3-oxoacyl-[acyl-carrier protein] reductase
MINCTKVVLVTGASRGIGRAIAIAFGTSGYRVAVGYNSGDQSAAKVVSEIMVLGGEALSVGVDVQSRASIKSALSKIRNTFGDVSILINNAAISQEKPFDEITDEDWDVMLSTNLRSAFICSQEVLPYMVEKKWGRIINLTSIGGQWGGINQIHYASSKAGLIGLTKSLGKTYSKYGITTNAIAPGLVATEMSANELTTNAGQEKVKNIPVGRLGSLKEISSAVIYLASDEASYITGQTINLNGGMYFG